MNKLLEVLKVCFTAIGGWLGFFLGSVEALIYTLLAFVILWGQFTLPRSF